MKMLALKVVIALVSVAVLGAGLSLGDAAKSESPGPPVQSVLVVSPSDGVFYARPYPGAPPYVKVGTVVEPATLVCRVDPIFAGDGATAIDVLALADGTVAEVIAADGDFVNFEQPLFRIQLKIP